MDKMNIELNEKSIKHIDFQNKKLIRLMDEKLVELKNNIQKEN